MVIINNSFIMMRYKFLTVFFTFLLIFPVVTNAQSVSVADIVARMDEIIKEMQSLKSEFDSLSGQVKPTGAVLGASTVKRITKTPVYGETNDLIGLIQKLLKTDPEIYPYQVVSGFFGPKTEEAIKNLQTRFKMNPVGVVGPATTELLEAFFAKYPDDNFPADALKSDPRGATPVVAGTSTSVLPTTTTNTPPAAGIGTIKAIRAQQTGSSADVAIYYKNGTIKEFKVTGTTRPQIVSAVSAKSGLTMSTVDILLVFGEITDDIGGDDETEAEDAIEAAEDAIDDAMDEIEEADDDGDDVDWAEDTIDEAWDLLEEAEEAFDDEDYEEAIELAEEAEDLADEAVERIDEEEESDDDEIDTIFAKVRKNLTEVTVEYEDGDEDDFDVDEDDIDDVIEAIADELDIDEDDVENLIEFDFDDIANIDVEVSDGDAEVSIKFNDGVKYKFTITEQSESKMIKAIAKKIGADEDDVEEEIDFEY